MSFFVFVRLKAAPKTMKEYGILTEYDVIIKKVLNQGTIRPLVGAEEKPTPCFLAKKRPNVSLRRRKAGGAAKIK
jgi:hypothetical protein